MKIRSVILLLFLGLWFVTSSACLKGNHHLDALKAHGLIIQGPLNVSEVEEQNLTAIDVKGAQSHIPFGRLNKDWLELKEQINNGGNLYFISSSESDWKKPLSGAFEGYGVFVEKCIVSFLRTKVS